MCIKGRLITGGLSKCGARVNPLEYVCGSDVIVFRSVTEKE